MSHPFPPEILDQIVDHLHDEPATLGACCLVSKSCVPRTRMHLFACVEFVPELPIGRWMKVFPDPSNSPAHYTQTLTVFGVQATTAVVADAGRWIRAFHNIVHLHLINCALSPFHGLSSAVRSLRLESPQARTSEILDFVCSFPLLEDLAFLLMSDVAADDWTAPSNLPRLTGSLELTGMVGGVGPMMRQLLDLQDGLRFTKITFMWADEADFKLAADLVSRCSATLESLYLTDDLSDPVFDISAATKLKQLVFQCNQPNVQWITMALQTVNSKDLREISVRPNSFNLRYTTPEPICREWEDLDRMLVQFWSSHSIRPKVTYELGPGRGDMRVDAPSLLPKLVKRGLVDLVEYDNYCSP